MLAPAVEFQNVTKKYHAIAANDQLCFKVSSGSIHGIIGENGAGKSTAMKLLFGLESPTSGDILFRGKPRPWSSPRGAMRHGIGMVHQHFMLSPAHSALDNVILGREIVSGSLLKRTLSSIDRDRSQSELSALAAQVGFNIPWQKPVALLPVGIQQQLEIIKLLSCGVDFMIFDEPTAVLSPEETIRFIELLRTLNHQGKTIVVITHKLQEVKDLADDITVFRRGRSIASRPSAELTIQEMADLMVGRHVQLDHLPRQSVTPGSELLQVKNLSVAPSSKVIKGLSDITIAIRESEIVGIAGVEGSGQQTLFDFLTRERTFRKHPLAHPVAIVPADRLREAVLVDESLCENDLLGHMNEFGIYWALGRQVLDRNKLKLNVQKMLADYDVRPADGDQKMANLSGGNQQKFVMGRELSRNPKIIFCAHPTRGVDVGSIEQIHCELLRQRANGAGILLISSQLDELMALSDVIHVMFEGRIVATFRRSEFDESRIGIAMGGAAMDQKDRGRP